jgi:Caspase domain
MGRFIRVAFVLLLASSTVAAQRNGARIGRPGESCFTAKDLIVQALEHLRADSPPSDLEDADQLLRRAIDLCAESGDAWYYRSLVEARLNHASKAEFAMIQARLFPSEALEQKLNPFNLATPASRGFGPSKPNTAALPSAAPIVPGPVQQKWALVIGISHFSDHGIRPLNYTTQDADAFAAELQDPKIGNFPADHVKKITDADATTKNIKEQLNWIARSAEPNDLIVIYVATHGSPRSLDSVSGINYLITYDTEMNTAGQLNEDAMYATALPMVELADSVATRMRALRTLVILDTCYSGGSVSNLPAAAAAAKAAPSRQMLEQMSQGTGRIVLAASQSDEESLESAKLGHGYFTYFLLQALKSGEGLTPMTKVYGEVSKSVSQLASEGGQRQHPVLYQSSTEADFSLRTALPPVPKLGL